MLETKTGRGYSSTNIFRARTIQLNPSCQPSGDIEHSLADDLSRGEPDGRLVRLDLRGQRDVSDDFTLDELSLRSYFSSRILSCPLCIGGCDYDLIICDLERDF